MEIRDKISIAFDFSQTPGARYKKDGKFSGEEFLELLEPRFKKALAEKYILQVDLDGVWGYPSSFVSGSFGKLSVNYTSEVVLNHISFKSDENPIRLERIIQEIKQPLKK